MSSSFLVLLAALPTMAVASPVGSSLFVFLTWLFKRGAMGFDAGIIPGIGFVW